MTQPRLAAVVVLAAGEGRRMRSATPKVLHRVAGRTLVDHVLAAVAPLGAERQLVVVGHGREQVAAALAGRVPEVTPVVQARQGGTGHAVRAALPAAGDIRPDDLVVVVPGDTPLLTGATMSALVAAHAHEPAAATVLTAEVPDPFGYGRVLRDPSGRIRAIVEQADADAATAAVREINTGVYVFTAGPLLAALSSLTADNAQGEEYLTDVVGAFFDGGRTVRAYPLDDPGEAAGVNDRVQLAAAAAAMRDRLVTAAMRAGVTVLDPATTWIDADVALEADVTLLPHTFLHGSTRVAAGAVIGPDCTLTDTLVGAAATVSRTTASRAVIGPDAAVGPYTHLREGTRVGRGVKLGAFVETKAAEIADGAKVPHLAYVGDAVIGARSNIGCGTIVANYDGVAKHRTVIGADVKIGSDTVLVAPVHVGDGAYTGAGSVVTEDVLPGALAVREGRQRTIEGWVELRRPGTAAARAAAAARGYAEQAGDDGGPNGVAHAGADRAGPAPVTVAGISDNGHRA
ncbi:bifunctional UDP-N-acetylglucosamine diphosphorylase/glucosamine-1-phosphate N-acetyltransferase GlmU [Frankia sp. CiP1_Cm_nod1]|uniref:bifunctional UDP-N-acetylglucosamine diphosphorylase/glucosamine-1-phosphate N-acetyltransferase GlmU n=1 Tax=Frankia sp. CiP1_Cm_nod1 TaxID=2897160 RepID=UPI004044001D